VLGIALNRFHQIGDEVVSALELNINPAKPLFRQISFADEAVVNRHSINHATRATRPKTDQRTHDMLLPFEKIRRISGEILGARRVNNLSINVKG
jgi:hypothetical protein